MRRLPPRQHRVAPSVPGAAAQGEGRVTTRDTGHTRKELRQKLQESADKQPLTTLCALCGWTYTGTAYEGRELAKGHRRVHHPEVKATRRKRGSLTRFQGRQPEFQIEGRAAAAKVAASLSRLEEAS